MQDLVALTVLTFKWFRYQSNRNILSVARLSSFYCLLLVTDYFRSVSTHSALIFETKNAFFDSKILVLFIFDMHHTAYYQNHSGT